MCMQKLLRSIVPDIANLAGQHVAPLQRASGPGPSWDG
jgi:hypothetical protein